MLDSRPSRHVVLKYSTSTATASANTMGDDKSRKRTRKKRTSMDTQVLEDQGVVINTRRNSSLRRSSRQSIIQEDGEDDDDDDEEYEADGYEDEDQTSSSIAINGGSKQVTELPAIRDNQKASELPQVVSEPLPAATTISAPEVVVVAPAPTFIEPIPAKPVGRPKGRPGRGRKAANPGQASGLRRGRRAAVAKEDEDTSATSTNIINKTDDQDYEFLEHQAELAAMQNKPYSHNPLAFESINALYSISLDAEDEWRVAADDLADCLWKLKNQWQILEQTRKQLIKDARTLNLQTNVHGPKRQLAEMTLMTPSVTSSGGSTLRDKSGPQRRNNNDSSAVQSSDSSSSRRRSKRRKI